MTKHLKSNPEVTNLIAALRKGGWKNDSALWRDVARRLEKPNRSWATVNVSKLPRVASKGETVLVPGRLLGSGSIDFPLTVASMGASESARSKVEAAGGKCISVRELFDSNPKGSKVRIIA